MEISERFVKIMIAYAGLSRYVNQRPPKLSDLPDEELKEIREWAMDYEIDVPLETREELPNNQYINGLGKKCFEILSDREKRRAEMKTLVGKSSQ